MTTDYERIIVARTLRNMANALEKDPAIRPSQFAWLYYPEQMAQKKSNFEYAAEKIRRLAEAIGTGAVALPAICRHCFDDTDGDDPAPTLCAMCEKAGRKP